jgi:hypothetical protein
MMWIVGAQVGQSGEVLQQAGQLDMKMKIVDLGLELSTRRQQEIAGSAVYKASVL